MALVKTGDKVKIIRKIANCDLKEGIIYTVKGCSERWVELEEEICRCYWLDLEIVQEKGKDNV